MTSSFYALLALFMLVACASKREGMKSKQAELYFGAGTQSLVDQQYTEALTSLLKANELEPENSEILNNLAMAYYFKGQVDIAIKQLNYSLKLNAKNTDARVNLASILYNEGKTEEAEKIYKQVLQDLTYDKQARTYYNLGLLELEKKKNSSAAENYFKKSIKEDENYCPSYFQLGLLQYRRRQFNTSLKNFKEASMGTCYNSPAPVYYEGLALTELNRFDEARIKFDEVTTRFGKSPFANEARNKAVELNTIEARYKSVESHASGKVLESPNF